MLAGSGQARPLIYPASKHCCFSMINTCLFFLSVVVCIVFVLLCVLCMSLVHVLCVFYCVCCTICVCVVCLLCVCTRRCAVSKTSRTSACRWAHVRSCSCCWRRAKKRLLTILASFSCPHTLSTLHGSFSVCGHYAAVVIAWIWSLYGCVHVLTERSLCICLHRVVIVYMSAQSGHCVYVCTKRPIV